VSKLLLHHQDSPCLNVCSCTKPSSIAQCQRKIGSNVYEDFSTWETGPLQGTRHVRVLRVRRGNFFKMNYAVMTGTISDSSNSSLNLHERWRVRLQAQEMKELPLDKPSITKFCFTLSPFFCVPTRKLLANSPLRIIPSVCRCRR
jgi:hypothetical protein